MRRTLIGIILTVTALRATAGVDWSYSYDGSGNVRQIGTDHYVYDVAGRLVQADTNGVRRNYEYDAFGNRKSCSQPGTDCQWGYKIGSGDNHIIGVEYTPAGNVRTFAGHTYSYDALNMLTRDESSAGIREYIYTADDERIAVYTVNTGSWHWTLRDTSGRVLREFTSQNGGSWKWVKDYIWRDNLLLATRQIEPGATTPTTYHYHLDHLGSPRQITDDANRIVGIHHYHPFGPEQTQNQQNEPSRTLLQYTAHERDLVGTVEGLDTLDYMHARYYSPALGRFSSVDPGRDWNPKQPQSWNMYAYVRNNPISTTDPSGREGVEVTCAPPRRCTQAKWEADGTAAAQRAQENAANSEYAKLAEEGKLEVNRGQVRPSTQQVAEVNGGPASEGMQLGHRQALVLNGAPLDPKNIQPEYASQNMSHGARIRNAVKGLADGTKITKWNFTLLGAGSVVMTLIQARSYSTFMANQEKTHPGRVSMGDMFRWVWTGDTTASPPSWFTSSEPF